MTVNSIPDCVNIKKDYFLLLFPLYKVNYWGKQPPRTLLILVLYHIQNGEKCLIFVSANQPTIKIITLTCVRNLERPIFQSVKNIPPSQVCQISKKHITPRTYDCCPKGSSMFSQLNISKTS
jgi:hypothetical protein